MSDITDKVGLLLTHAENCSTEEERNAYLTKAQALATSYSIDLELARQRQKTKELREVPEARKISLAERGGKYNKHFCNLFMAIGKPNDLKFDIAHNSTYVIAFGYPSDIDVTERLYASLLVQMTRAAQAAVDAGEHKWDENLYWSERTYEMRADARVFKGSFYEGFISVVGARLRAAKAEVEAKTIVVEGQETTGALVLVDKKASVNSFHKEKSTARGTWGGNSGSSAFSRGAVSSGRAAGQAANLHGTRTSLPGSRQAIGA